MIRALYIARCGRCGLHPAPMSSPAATIEDVVIPALRETEHDAVALAVQNGWSPYPLLCPPCNQKFKETIRDGGGVSSNHDPENDPRVP